MRRALARFGPPVAWMGVIALLSGQRFGADETAAWLLPLLARVLPWAGPEALHGLHTILRKLGHLTEYGILAALWLRALDYPSGRDASGPPASGYPPPRRRALLPNRSPAGAARWAVGLSALYAAADELRQGLAPNRSPAVLDVAIDAAGALVAVACLQAPGPLGAGVVWLGRWLAFLVALGSLGAAALDWSLGLPAWDLGLAALGAAAAAWALGARARHWHGAP